MSNNDLQKHYQTLKRPGAPKIKNNIIESLSPDEAITLLKMAFYSVTADPTLFTPKQKFLAVSLDHEYSLLYADVSTGFKDSLTECIDSTTLYQPDIRKLYVLLFKLPSETEDISEAEARKLVASISSTGITPEDLYNNADRYELVHVQDLLLNS
ncbi:hypothetical protein [Paenibacillus sp. Y412MC10]|uniref:hypothetical protein n=1 Tax=Geobacillus sp. (strain Y412MC10) TaxID=481743 RepID=UPI0011AB841C|nr:hypothetical protein [Paenibacillus sp. Y412MC10]